MGASRRVVLNTEKNHSNNNMRTHRKQAGSNEHRLEVILRVTDTDDKVWALHKVKKVIMARTREILTKGLF